jgi:hypothetical protein
MQLVYTKNYLSLLDCKGSRSLYNIEALTAIVTSPLDYVIFRAFPGTKFRLEVPIDVELIYISLLKVFLLTN